MYVSKIDNQPNFGLTYINKHAWNPTLLKTIEGSKLAHEIDKKYPLAYASYISIADKNAGAEKPSFHMSFILKLAKDKIWSFNHNSVTKGYSERLLAKILKQKSLCDVEKESVSKVETLDFAPVESQNPLVKLWRRFFN